MSRITRILHQSLLVSTLSLGMLTAAFAQVAPTPAPAATAVPTISASPAADIFFTGKLLPANWLVSDAMNEPVRNLQKEKIGEINDIIVDGDGRIVAAVIGIGGFLGMGEKDVAINYKAIHASRDEKGKTSLTLDVSKEALKAAPAYQPVTVTTKRS